MYWEMILSSLYQWYKATSLQQQQPVQLPRPPVKTPVLCLKDVLLLAVTFSCQDKPPMKISVTVMYVPELFQDKDIDDIFDN